MVDEAKEKPQQFVLDDLVTVGIETRVGLRDYAVTDYEERIREGKPMDPGVVFIDPDDPDRRPMLAAGHHRKEAYRQAGWPRDALCFGIRDNQQHKGERLSLADRRHNVKRVLEEQPGMSSSAIAELCEVSRATVEKYRTTCQNAQVTNRMGRDGITRSTANIGRKPAAIPDGDQTQTQPVERAQRVAIDHAEEPSAGQPEASQTPAEPPGQTAERTPGDRDANAVVQMPAAAVEPPTDSAAVDPIEDLTTAGREAEEDQEYDDPLPSCSPAPDPAAVDQAFKELMRSLGRLKKQVHAFAELVSGGPCYPATIEILSRAGDEMRRWREEVSG